MAELTTITFSDLSIWDVKNYFRQQDAFNGSYPLVLFGEFLNKPIIKKTKIDDDNEYRILGVRSYGKGAYINRTVKGNTLKMRIYQVAPKDHLFWCKVDTKNGAFGIIDDNLANGVASSNMTFAEIDKSKASTEYVQLLFTSPKVNQYMDGYVTGTTNRKYIKLNQLLEEIKIPLPPLSEQNRIVSQYNQKIKLAKQQEQEANNLEQEIETYLFKELDVKQNLSQEVQKGIQTVTYDSIVKWSLDDIFKKNRIKSEKYPLVTIDSVCSKITDGTHQTPKYFDKGVTFLSAKNVTKEVIDWKNIKYVSKDAHIGYTKTIKPEINDILLAKNGTTGVAAIVEDEKEFSIYVSLALLRPVTQKVMPHFLLRVINSDIARIQFASRLIGIGVPNLHLGEIREVKIPLPPKNIQLKIVNKVSEEKRKIKSLKDKAKQNRKEALLNFEQEIFNS